MQTLPQREGTAAPHDELLDCRAVCAFFGGIDPATLYRGIRKRRFPGPIKVGPNTSRWLRSEIEAALSAMIARRVGVMNMKQGKPIIDSDGVLDTYRTDRDLFLTLDGETIARRGHPGTPQAGRWIPLRADIEAIEEDQHDRILILRSAAR